MRVPLLTWSDLIDHLTDWMGANPTAEARRDARRASLAALREVAGAHHWTYYLTRGRVNTVAPYATGTVAYDHTGGAEERLVTLTGGVWPAWAALGSLVLGGVPYEVYARLDDARLTLSVNSNPGGDVAAGTAFTLYRDQYTLPANFQAMGELVILTQSRVLGQEHPSSWLARQRVWHGPSTPVTYALMGDPNYQNALAVALFPAPDQAYAIDFIYKRRPRELRVDAYSTGTVAGAAGQATLSGTGTAWDARMAGAVVRVGTAADVPTARWGDAPAAQERLVVSVQSATSLTVDAAWDDSFSGVKHLISDPVDIDTPAMETALLRKAELETGHARTLKNRAELVQLYQLEVVRARELDARSFAEQAAGGGSWWPARLADMPLGSDRG